AAVAGRGEGLRAGAPPAGDQRNPPLLWNPGPPRRSTEETGPPRRLPRLGSLDAPPLSDGSNRRASGTGVVEALWEMTADLVDNSLFVPELRYMIDLVPIDSQDRSVHAAAQPNRASSDRIEHGLGVRR